MDADDVHRERFGIVHGERGTRVMITWLAHAADIDEETMSCTHLKHAQAVRDHGGFVRMTYEAEGRVEG